MTHTSVRGSEILRGSDLVLHTERAEGAPDGIYGVTCLMCEAASGLVDSDPKHVEVWALEHARHNGLTHNQFLFTTDRHCRVDPLHPPDFVPAEKPSEQTLRLAPIDPAPQARTRVRRRTPQRWRTAARRAAAHAGDLSGPFVVLALTTVCTLGGYLLGTG